MQVVVLAGGLATRLRPLTTTVPKALIPVAGRPFVDHQLVWLRTQGVRDVVLCIGFLGERIRQHVGDGSRHGLHVAYVDEGSDLRGTAGAVRLAFDQGVLASAFGVLYGDSYLTASLGAVGTAYEASGLPALMTVYRNEGRFDTSNARLEGGLVVHYEKGLADPGARGMLWIDYGFTMLDRDAVIATLPGGEVLDLAEVVGTLAAERRLAGFEVYERFYEIGSLDGLHELEALLS
jgi:NDP-sugar pyrophosphorylase family protein